jgi:HPr kinase/phosphorylase
MINQELTVKKLYTENRKRLSIKLLSSDAGFHRVIKESDLHRPGLALAGFIDLFTYTRVQILGNTEIRYLKTLSSAKKVEALEKMFEFEIPCIFITESNRIPPVLIELANEKQICVFRSRYPTTAFSHLLSDCLQNYFAPTTSVHGTLVDVYGIGLLFTGKSGIGKSEISLDLVERGHRLVADDVVRITKKSEEILMAEPDELAAHHLEIRGLGIIDVKGIFGIRAVRIHKRLEVEVKLVQYNPRVEYDRLGLDATITKILGVEIPQVTLPINPGKNITVIAETIALNQLMKLYGHHTPREFAERLQKKMRKKELMHIKKLMKRDYIEKDYE